VFSKRTFQDENILYSKYVLSCVYWMTFLFRQSTFGHSHHTIRNIPRLDDQKGGQDLFHFAACHQLFASVYKTIGNATLLYVAF